MDSALVEAPPFLCSACQHPLRFEPSSDQAYSEFALITTQVDTTIGNAFEHSILTSFVLITARTHLEHTHPRQIPSGVGTVPVVGLASGILCILPITTPKD
jgi:hypothetical protein